MSCEQTTLALDDLLDGTLTPERATSVEAHVVGCESCRRLVERERNIRRVLRELPIDGPYANFEARMLGAAYASKRAATRRAAAWLATSAAALFVGLLATGVVERPGARNDVATVANFPTIAITPAQTRTVNLVFASETALEGVSLILELPMGVELRGYPGLAQVRWTTMLSAGRNILPLELNASSDATGELVARLVHDGRETVFRIPIANTG